jgi:hypothetical protein
MLNFNLDKETEKLIEFLTIQLENKKETSK